MNPGMIFYILSWVGCFSGLFLLPSCIVALIYHEPQGFAYLGVAAFYILFGFLLLRDVSGVHIPDVQEDRPLNGDDYHKPPSAADCT